MRLIKINRDGSITEPLALCDEAAAVCTHCASMYENNDYLPPWIAYLAYEENINKNEGGVLVGTCAFKSPPIENQVEIAYFIFPDYENRGLATVMASKLIALAQTEDPGIIITAQTLPENNASTAILKKLGFDCEGEIMDADDGKVWNWKLSTQ